MRRVLVGALAAIGTAIVVAACSGTTPTSPNPGIPPPNTPPTIKSIALSDSRAEVGTPITVTATVEDQETPVATLTYAWSSDAGTFTGTGAVVTWLAPANAVTPADDVLTLTVTERYTSGSATLENKVSSATSVHVNNSPKELADLSLRFLTDFATSSVPPTKCVSEFSDSCSGKKDEFNDISNNRHDFLILSSTLRSTSVDMASGLKATVHTFCAFTSRVITTAPLSCSVKDCPFNDVQSVEGDCFTTNVYEQGRWWLCESRFTGKRVLTAFERAFFGIRRYEIP